MYASLYSLLCSLTSDTISYSLIPDERKSWQFRPVATSCESYCSWPNLDLNQPPKKLKFSTTWEHERRESAVQCLAPFAAGVISVPRGDYRECAEVAIVLLGETPPQGFHWRRPGAVHNARWMAKVSDNKTR